MKRRSAIWDAICHAIGVPYRTAGKVVSVAAQPPSTVTWTPLTRHFLTGGDTARSALLAATCNNCHGDTGVSSDAAIPNLAGQTVAAIYKQLDDFKSTRRNPPSWGSYVASLSQQDLFDLAAHFASLRNPFVRAT